MSKRNIFVFPGEWPGTSRICMAPDDTGTGSGNRSGSVRGRGKYAQEFTCGHSTGDIKAPG